MAYKVIRTFKDGQSKDLHVYRNGDVFPFGYEVSEARIVELLGSDNAIGMPLIVEVIDKDNVTEPLVIVEPQPIVEEEKPKRTRKKKVVQEPGQPMLGSPQQVVDAQRYASAALTFVTTLILGAEAFLRNAGAYREQNDLTPTVIHLIVGFWLDNRDSNYTEYVKIGDFPLGLQALITSLQYSAEDVIV